ncbi:MAG TPA: hypothetical protein DD417_15885 [Elusimicrobia bacterium]|nr:hypothetical protein [Elusimicrobiota bacterium]
MQETNPEATLPRPAGWLLRTGAFAIDMAALALILRLLEVAAWYARPASADRIVTLCTWVGVPAYFVVTVLRSFRTPGQAFVGLGVVRVDRHPLGWQRILGRTTLFLLTAALLAPINLILMPLNERGRAIHDWAAGTWVLAAPTFDRRRRALAVAAAALLGVWCFASLLQLYSRGIDWVQALELSEIGEAAELERP